MGIRPSPHALSTGAGARLDDGDLEPPLPRLQRRHQPDRSAAGHDQVDGAPRPGGGRGHARLPLRGGAASSRSAAFSHRIRVRSSTALATVKTSAVTQAVCTSGSANPSTTTAT